MSSRFHNDRTLRRIYAGLIVATIAANAGLIWSVFSLTAE
jgi:hypothetical protein